MSKKLTRFILFQSMVLFLINDVEQDTKESGLDIYKRWKKKCNIVLHNPETAAYVLEYFEAQKNCRRDAMREAAKIDGYLR